MNFDIKSSTAAIKSGCWDSRRNNREKKKGMESHSNTQGTEKLSLITLTSKYA